MSTPFHAPGIIHEQAAQFGFDEVRFAAVAPAPGIDEYDQFLSEGRQGDMEWMARSRPPRADPLTLLPTARSAIVLGMSYAHPRPPAAQKWAVLVEQMGKASIHRLNTQALLMIDARITAWMRVLLTTSFVPLPG